MSESVLTIAPHNAHARVMSRDRVSSHPQFKNILCESFATTCTGFAQQGPLKTASHKQLYPVQGLSSDLAVGELDCYDLSLFACIDALQIPGAA
jgi:hypothetical protein